LSLVNLAFLSFLLCKDQPRIPKEDRDAYEA